MGFIVLFFYRVIELDIKNNEISLVLVIFFKENVYTPWHRLQCQVLCTLGGIGTDYKMFGFVTSLI